VTFLSPGSRAVAGISVLAVLFVVGGAATAASAVSTTWSAPVNVATTGNNESLRIVVDASGLATAVWDSNNTVQASTSLNGGAWSSPATVSTTGTNTFPQVTVDGSGRATAVWNSLDATSNYTVLASFSVSGGTWSSPTTVSTTAGPTIAQITVDGSGRATAVWALQNSFNNSVQASSSLDGVTWSSPATLATTGPVLPDPQVTADGSGHATAVWRDNSGLHARTSLNGATWTASVNVSAPAAFDPQITVDATGRFTAVWTSPDANQHYIVQASTSLPGVAWSTPVNVSPAGQDAYTPQITVDGSGRITAVWDRFDGSNNIVQGSSSLDGVTWSGPDDLSVTGQNADSQQVTVDGSGLATAVWERFDGNNYIVQASTSLNGAPWSAPVNLSTLGQDGFDPQITANKSGFATAAWLLDGGENNIVQASFFDSRVPDAPVLAATGIDTATLAPTTIFALAAILAGISMIHLRRSTQAPAPASPTHQQHHTRTH